MLVIAPEQNNRKVLSAFFCDRTISYSPYNTKTRIVGHGKPLLRISIS